MSIEQDTTSSKTQPASAASVEVPSNIQRQSLGQLLRGDLGFIPVLATFVAIVIYFQITTNGLFLLPVNISNLLQQIATTGIDALGVTLVLLLGEIDLSVASVGTFGAVVMGVLLRAGAGMSCVQMKHRMGVAVCQRERQQHHQTANERGPLHGNEHATPKVIKVRAWPE